jgi:hypothetical protein
MTKPKPVNYYDIDESRRKGLWQEQKPTKSDELPKESRFIRDSAEHNEYLRDGYIIKDDEQ